jgi:hypothetical protein
MSETSMTAVVEYGPGQLKLETIPIPTALVNLPVIKKDKVDYYYSQLYVKPQDFLQTLPELIKKNMASGDYASQ